LRKAINNRKFILSFFLIAISVFFVGLSSEIVYSQGYDKSTVLKVQKTLQEMGYNPGPLDGLWGKKTKNALIKFQNDHGLSMTGKLDSTTKEKLGLIPLEKSRPKQSTPAISIQEDIKEALESTWEIKKVKIENDKLTIVPYFDFINKQEYSSMILELCRNAYISNQLKEIWILNANQNQGWVLLRAEKCNEIVQAPLDQVDKFIFMHSADVFIFESR
jgi:hypothetical protein